MDYLVDLGSWTPGLAKSLLLELIYLLAKDRIDAPVSVMLLQHYVEGSGEAFDLVKKLGAVPEDWQNWIVLEARRQSRRRMVNSSYKMKAYDKHAPYDLRHSLGTFSVQIARDTDQTLKYVIEDKYHFGFDCSKKDLTSNRHGFKLPNLTDDERRQLERLLPTRTYHHKCGFMERFAVGREKNGWFLYVPLQLLEENGTVFSIVGQFVRSRSA
jgi:hypothetical protein